MRDPVREQLAAGPVADAAVAQLLASASTSCAGTRSRREPRLSTSAWAGGLIDAQSARRSTSAIRASPLTVAASSVSVPRIGVLATRSATVVC